MGDVIQFIDRRRAKQDAIAAKQGEKELQFCLTLAHGYSPQWRPQALEAILRCCKQPEYVRKALREMGDAV